MISPETGDPTEREKKIPQDDGEGKLLDGSLAAGPDRRMKDSRKDLSKREKKKKQKRIHC